MKLHLLVALKVASLVFLDDQTEDGWSLLNEGSDPSFCTQVMEGNKLELDGFLKQHSFYLIDSWKLSTDKAEKKQDKEKKKRDLQAT